MSALERGESFRVVYFHSYTRDGLIKQKHKNFSKLSKHRVYRVDYKC